MINISSFALLLLTLFFYLSPPHPKPWASPWQGRECSRRVGWVRVLTWLWLCSLSFMEGPHPSRTRVKGPRRRSQRILPFSAKKLCPLYQAEKNRLQNLSSCSRMNAQCHKATVENSKPLPNPNLRAKLWPVCPGKKLKPMWWPAWWQAERTGFRMASSGFGNSHGRICFWSKATTWQTQKKHQVCARHKAWWW